MSPRETSGRVKAAATQGVLAPNGLLGQPGPQELQRSGQ